MNYTFLIQALGRDKLKFDEPLSQHTYFKLGGPADLLYEAKTSKYLIHAAQSAIFYKVPYFVLGGGSNILITDSGFRGLIIKNKSSDLKLKGIAGGVAKGKVDLKEAIVQVDSGVPANLFIRYTLDQGFAGLENLLGLPGTVGGAVYNNSHHLGHLFGDHIIEVDALSVEGKIKKYTQKELKFDYDYSIFHKTKEVILSTTFQLKRQDKNLLWQIANNAVKRRATTQPLGIPSSGCIFKNIPLADQMRLGLSSPSVGYLIDKAGLKGTRVGGAFVSDTHANFIVNDKTATTKDVLDLIILIKAKIKTKFGVNLTEEVIII
ncbi:UDP-N-acetylenolpyruvoylglucosamine reductase [Candidatus Collierbacteria bacterium CG10_big_fil_rev_8_21_14_0_10_44_9]|uniref:UDP-N-acetylenolpyruvoylglucosamine reductase n=1 Tax=Candidatus Collierbacteria bacterium CG10_big_fil_rev_8_21_14_0_10_44_9 TaxID=1974535 RepID=A0A2H0VI48_9BACT|nr:MAG: UDP-N-acetylenolpyruvoylglucosamine reductase [Candidatus Collierbacteria bacterium CG10_big_fil_rev_8_21_14_0_10_44_9]